MRSLYIHERQGWPHLKWDEAALTAPLAEVRHVQGRLLGRMESLGFQLREEASLEALTEDVLKTSEIEGERLDPAQVRSSLARRMGLEAASVPVVARNVEGIVEIMLDATRHAAAPLTAERLFGWHAALFPTGRSGTQRITVGAWRPASSGAMRVVSGPFGREKVHFEAPDHGRVPGEMRAFLAWFNASSDADPVLISAVAHFRFVTIHPFEDGNGRIARAIADMMLARADGTEQRFYSMSAQIQAERNAYYDILERCQKGGLDITAWIDWCLRCLRRAIGGSEVMLAGILAKARFWKAHEREPFNERQRAMLNRLLDGFVGNLTSTKWAKLGKCSQDTALRDIEDLMARKILARGKSGGRSTSYLLR